MYIVYEAASTFLFDHCLLRVVSEETKAVLTIKWNILLLKCHKSRNSHSLRQWAEPVESDSLQTVNARGGVVYFS